MHTLESSEAAAISSAGRLAGPRDVLFDNARYVAVCLVMVGHFLEPARNMSSWTRGLFLTLYLFHVPLLAFISGRFSSSRLDRRTGTRMLDSLVIPYLALETLYSVAHHLVFAKGDLSIAYVTPYMHLWYLVSLLTWRLLLPLVATLRWPLATTWAVAMLAGFLPDAGHGLSISRSLVFLPFFVLGYQTRRESFAGLATRRARLVALVVFGTVAVLFLTYGPYNRLDPKWVQGATSYAGLGKGLWLGLRGRVAISLAGFVLVFAVLAWLPRGRVGFTDQGARSLYPYLLHVVLVKAAVWMGVYKGDYRGLTLIGLFVAVPLLYRVLASDPVVRATDWVVRPVWLRRWLLKPTPPGAGAAQAPPRTTSRSLAIVRSPSFDD